MEEVDSRFLHLLQPIRDLTKNWEVDVAAQLEEYLEELDHIGISFDNGKTTMNFTEAALVIQGSASIYSKKVEYLYMLVCQALDYISNKKGVLWPVSPSPAPVGSLGVPGVTLWWLCRQLLSLDDIKDTSQASMHRSRNRQREKPGVRGTRPLLSLPPGEGESLTEFSHSRKGEVLASQKDFRMNTYTPHPTGTFLLEQDGLSPTHPQEQHLGSPRGATGTWGGLRGGNSLVARLEMGSRSLSSLCPFPPAGAAGADDDDDIPGALGDDVEMTPAPDEHIEAQRSSPRPRGYMLREKAPSQDPKAPSKEVPDPWQSLDPFVNSEEKPFRKGRPFLMSHSLDDVVGGKRKRRGPRKLQDFTRWFSAAYNDVTESRKTRRKGPTFADLEVLYWQQLKERLAAQRKLKSQGVSGLGAAGGSQGALRGSRAGGALRGLPFPEDDDFVEHEDVEQEDMEPEGHGLPGRVGVPPCTALSLSPQELFIASSQKFVQETELSQRIQRWEERIEPLLQEQARTPGRAGTPRAGAGTTGRAQAPGEARVPFDVRAYGLALMERCGELGQWHSFASLVARQPPFEVCRYLLASLQLANDGVVELAQDEGLEEALDTARLRLLTLHPAHERFQGLQLSSLRD
ncbi:CNDH2 protein, partial [Tyrannus savana]|nr:CNDH2 protein [Tyrannus savana]